MLHRNPARVAAPRAKRPCLVLMLRVMAGSGAPIDGTFGPSAGDPAWPMLADKNRVRCQGGSNWLRAQLRVVRHRGMTSGGGK